MNMNLLTLAQNNSRKKQLYLGSDRNQQNSKCCLCGDRNKIDNKIDNKICEGDTEGG